MYYENGNSMFHVILFLSYLERSNVAKEILEHQHILITTFCDSIWNCEYEQERKKFVYERLLWIDGQHLFYLLCTKQFGNFSQRSFVESFQGKIANQK